MPQDDDSPIDPEFPSASNEEAEDGKPKAAPVPVRSMVRVVVKTPQRPSRSSSKKKSITTSSASKVEAPSTIRFDDDDSMARPPPPSRYDMRPRDDTPAGHDDKVIDSTVRPFLSLSGLCPMYSFSLFYSQDMQTLMDVWSQLDSSQKKSVLDHAKGLLTPTASEASEASESKIDTSAKKRPGPLPNWLLEKATPQDQATWRFLNHTFPQSGVSCGREAPYTRAHSL